MLQLIYRLQDIHYGQLMRVYAQAIAENGSANYPRKGRSAQIMLAEQDLYDYLRFILVDHCATIAVWAPQGQYEAVLRLEEYRDGLLIAGLETAPEARNRGYASALLMAVVRQFSSKRLYSHIGKQNLVSLHLHEKCGFRRISDQAVYLDGSVSDNAYTYLLEV